MNEQATILIIDDDESYNFVLSRALTRRNFLVYSALNPASALTHAANTDPEYIVLDLNLAGYSGINLIRPLLEHCPDARIVILTGYASIPTTVNAIKLGAYQYLAKPASVTDIIKAVTGEDTSITLEQNDQIMSVQRLEWEYIQRVLAEHAGNITATAKALKMHRRTLQRKLTKHSPPA